MALKAYVPFTDARRRRLYSKALHNMKGDAEVLLQIEYPDGTEQFKPANWNANINAWQTEDDERWYSKGRGGEPGNLLGCPIVHVDSQNAGVVSREAAKAARREELGHYVDEDGRPIEVVERDEHGGPQTVRYVDQDGGESIAADGGDVELHYDFGQGEVIDRRLAGYFDPFPVSRQEADQAVAYAESSALDQGEILKMLLIGVGLGAGLIIAFIVILWLMGQIGNGNGAETLPMVINSLHVVV